MHTALHFAFYNLHFGIAARLAFFVGAWMSLQEPDKVKWLKEQLYRERRARALLQDVAVAASHATTSEEILQVAIERICNSMGWPVGHVYLRSDETTLSPAPIWRLQEADRFEVFRKITEATPMPIGVGLPGRVLADGKPAWIMDVHNDPNFPRMQVTRELGVRAGFGFPVLVGGYVLAVLEFFSDQAVEPDEQLLEVMANIGTTLGRIIQQRRAEDAVRESEMRFRSVAQSASDAIITASSLGLIISWNKAAENMFGYSEGEAMGKPLTLLIPERFQEAHLRGLQRVNTTGESRVIGRTVELAGVRNDGVEFPLELSLASWRLGEQTFYSGIIRDISERKLAEQTLRNFAQELERRVQEGIDALREAERMAAYGNMVACVAHEIRHPIFALRSTAYLLKEKIKSQEGLEPQFAMLDRETNRIARLMDDLLEFARPHSLMLARVDPGSILQQAKEEFLALGDANLHVDVIASELPPLLLDHDRILQVLVNLMINAQKHAKGITNIRLAAEPVLRGMNSGNTPIAAIRFSVANDGAGIPEENLAHIFEPFFTTGKGTGLGLAIVRRIIQEHEGTVHVESLAQNGATFSFVLPINGPQNLPSDKLK